MDTYLLSHLIVLGTLLLVSMFFSAVETSLLSFPRLALQRRAQEPGLLGGAFKEWQEHPNRILTSILIGNNAVSIAATTLVAYTAIHLAEVYQWSLAITGAVASVSITFIIIVFGEAIPKVAARNNSVRMATFLVIPVYLFDRLISPFTWALMMMIKSLLPKILGRPNVVQVTEEDVKQLIEMGQKAGTIQEEEKNMIHSIFKFTDTKVNEIMIPRTDMFCVDINIPFERLLDQMVHNGYSRVPAYKGSLDNIVGILHTRDLLSIWRNKELIVVQDLLRKPHFVPESMRADRLLRDFRRGKYHMAIVVDEYGGTAGMVTLEDLVQQIVGEIRDEHDSDEDKPIVLQADGSWIIEADVALDDVNQAAGLHLVPKGEVASLGGYVMEIAGKVPKKGRVIEDKEAVFRILEASDKSILRVKVTKRKTPLPTVETETAVTPAPKPRKKRVKTPVESTETKEVEAKVKEHESKVEQAQAKESEQRADQ
jgi:putative hemolysin